MIEEKDSIEPQLRQLGDYYAHTGDHKLAEKFYLQGRLFNEAIQMYNEAGEWERAHRIASSHLSEGDVTMMYVSQAEKLEGEGKLKEAEKLYVSVGEPDLAITMYKKHRKYDQVCKFLSI